MTTTVNRKTFLYFKDQYILETKIKKTGTDSK